MRERRSVYTAGVRLSALYSIPEGPSGTLATLNTMRQLAIQGKTYLPLRQLTLSLVQSIPSKNFLSEAQAIHRFVRDRIRYVMDVHNVETLHTVDAILANGQGDCDDKAILAAAMLESIGHPARFVAMGRAPGEFSHVYVETLISGNWRGMELTEPKPFGWEPSDMPYRMIVAV